MYGYGLLNILSDYNRISVNVPPPNVNLTLNKPVTVSSYQDLSHASAMAVDGYPSTLWQPKNRDMKLCKESGNLFDRLGTPNKKTQAWVNSCQTGCSGIQHPIS